MGKMADTHIPVDREDRHAASKIIPNKDHPLRKRIKETKRTPKMVYSLFRTVSRDCLSAEKHKVTES